jgi:hypothetical protein
MKTAQVYPPPPHHLRCRWSSESVNAEQNVVAPVGLQRVGDEEPAAAGWPRLVVGSFSKVGDSVRLPYWPSTRRSTWSLPWGVPRGPLGHSAWQYPTSQRLAALASWKPLCFCILLMKPRRLDHNPPDSATHNHRRQREN